MTGDVGAEETDHGGGAEPDRSKGDGGEQRLCQSLSKYV
jgi:hypothetical protein